MEDSPDFMVMPRCVRGPKSWWYVQRCVSAKIFAKLQSVVSPYVMSGLRRHTPGFFDKRPHLICLESNGSSTVPPNNMPILSAMIFRWTNYGCGVQKHVLRPSEAEVDVISPFINVGHGASDITATRADENPRPDGFR